MLTLDVACYVGGLSILFLCPDSIYKGRRRGKQMLKGEKYEEKLNYLKMYANCTKIMLVKSFWFFHFYVNRKSTVMVL